MNFTIEILTRNLVADHIRDFITLAKDTIVNEYWNENNFLAELDKKWELSIVAMDDAGVIRGFLIASQKEESIHIHKFVIDSSMQGLGLGRLMFSNFQRKSGRPITLKVQKENAKAIRFYDRNGFVVDRENADSYQMILN